jgi:hypothetical protein
MLKEHLEFFTLNLFSGWETAPGTPRMGVFQQPVS